MLDDRTPSPAPSTHKNRGRQFIAAAVVLLVFFFIFRNLAVNAEKIRSYPFELHPGYLLASFACLWATVLWYGVVWHRILSILDPSHRVSLPLALQVSIYAWLGRYVPGKVVAVVSRVYAARGRQASEENLYLSSVLDAVLAIVSGLVLALICLAFGGGAWLGEGRGPYVVVLVAGSASLVLGVDSPLFYRAINMLLRLARRAPISSVPRMTIVQRASTLCLFALGQALRGLGFYLFVRALIPVNTPPLPSLMGTFILAGALGSASIFVPAGLGVRDGVLAIGLQGWLPTGIASTVAIASRVWETVADILLMAATVIGLQYVKLRKKHWNGSDGR